MLLQRDKVFLHAAAIEKNGRVYLFSGPAGSGKTTIAEKSNSVLCDEAVVLTGGKNGIDVFPAMIGGKYPAREPLKLKLSEIYFLNKANELKKRELSPQDNLYNIMNNSFAFMFFEKRSPEVIKTIFKVSSHYSTIIKSYELCSRKDDDIWKIIA